MIRCKNCKSIKVEVIEDSSSEESLGCYFLCQTCGDCWDNNPEAEKLYLEFMQLMNETRLVVQTLGPGGTYTPQYLDIDKLIRRKEIAKTLVNSYEHVLNIRPGEWYEIHQDARL